MAIVKLADFEHHITGETIYFPYYPECPFAKQDQSPTPREDRFTTVCNHPKRRGWRKCLTHHIIDPECGRIALCPMEREQQENAL